MLKAHAKLTTITSVIVAFIGLGPGVGAAHAAVGAVGVGTPAASLAAAGVGLTPFYLLGFELGPWQAYLAQELTPDYLLDKDAPPVRVSWLRNSDVMLLPDFANKLDFRRDTYFYMNFESQSSADYLSPSVQPDATFQGSRFERQYFTPGIERQLNDGGVVGVSAVIAYQRYSSASMGMFAATSPDALSAINTGYRPYAESGYGTGVRLAVRQEIVSGLALETGFQSRIDMEEFAAYRGVYANPADLDIPARARVGLGFKASARSWLNVAVERVLYSDINAFPSRFLPNRLLSLLGDSTSPSFNWDDLTVYTVGWSWSDDEGQNLHVDVSTRPQPSPSSFLLREALEADLADSAVTVGYSRRTGRQSQFRLNAAYAPAEFAFGGSVLGVTTDDLDQRFEVEALWTVKF